MDFFRQHTKRQIFPVMLFNIILSLSDILLFTAYHSRTHTLHICRKGRFIQQFHFPEALTAPSLLQKLLHFRIPAGKPHNRHFFFSQPDRRTIIKTGILLFPVRRQKQKPAVSGKAVFKPCLILPDNSVQDLLSGLSQSIRIPLLGINRLLYRKNRNLHFIGKKQITLQLQAFPECSRNFSHPVSLCSDNKYRRMPRGPAGLLPDPGYRLLCLRPFYSLQHQNDMIIFYKSDSQIFRF